MTLKLAPARARRRAGLALVLALPVALAACGGSGSSGASTPSPLGATGSPAAATATSSADPMAAPGASSPAPSGSSASASAGTLASGPSGSPSTAAAPAGDAALRSVVLAPTDVAKGLTLKLYEQGDQVRGQVTLDLCGYRFTTEAHRIARRQVALVDPKGENTGLSNEVVRYDSPAQAAKALAEWKLAVKGCRKGVYVASTVRGAPALRFDALSAGTLATLPVKENVLSSFAASAKGISTPLYGLAILQRRGDLVSIIWYTSGVRVNTTARDNVYGAAAATGRHLAGIAATSTTA